MLKPHRLFVALGVAVIGLGVLSGPAAASHSWAGYHWARTANPFTLKVGDNVSSTWDAYLSTASSDWSASSVLDTTIVAGSAGSVRRCSATAGRVEVCNASYGSTGWLGIASVWASGTHITQGTVKMNDTYFNTSTYNQPAWRNLVMCQEVGHTLGLTHQDENFTNPNLGTCMDYTNDPSTNQHPNQHDYDQLALIYGHVDSTTTVASSTASSPADGGIRASEWGRVIRTSSDGRPSLYVRDLGADRHLFTFVVWAG